MANISRKQVGIIAIPLVLIAVLLPVALVIANFTGENRDDTDKPEEAANVAGTQAPEDVSADTVVRMEGQKFTPDEFITDPGSEVLWLNDDGSQHHIQFRDMDIDSGDLEPGATWTWTVPDDPGEYDFVCIIHENQMQGTVTIR